MSASTTHRRRLRLLAPATVALVLAIGLPAGSAHAGSGLEPLFRGDAWGSLVTQHNTVASGHSAPVVLDCLTTPGKTETNEVGAVHAPQNMFDTGHVVDTAQSLADAGGGLTSKSTSELHGLSMLGGMITADSIKSVSAVTRKNGAYSFSTAGSVYHQLVVNGQSVGQPAQHQVIPLPGIGRLVLFDAGHSADDAAATQFNNALTVQVLQPNDQGIPVGTKMTIGHSRSGFGLTAGPLGGRAWGSSVLVGGTVESGPSFTTYLPCRGTDGNVIQRSGSASHLPAPIVLGQITTTAVGTVGRAVSSGETSSRVTNADLGGGQITADLIKADVKIQRKDGQITFDTSGSYVGGLAIQGQGQSGTPPPNTVIPIPGLGKVTLYEVTRGPNFVEVRMLHLQVLQDNPDIPLGTDVVLGYAKVSVH